MPQPLLPESIPQRLVARVISIAGGQAGLLAAQPNWDTEIKINLELPTDVSKEPITFSESRRNFAQSARYRMEWRSYLSDAAASTELRIFLNRIYELPILVPLWPDVCELQTPVVAGGRILTMRDTPVRFGAPWIITDENFITWEIILISSLELPNKRIHLPVGGVSRAYPAGTLLYPLLTGRLEERPKPEAITDETMDVDFKIKENSDFGARITPASSAIQIVGGNVPTFQMLPKWNVAPNHVRPLDWTEMPDVIYEHVGFLRQEQQRVYDHRTPRGQELEFYQSDRESAAKIEYFWRDRRATTLRFMIPTYRGDLRMLEDTDPSVLIAGYNNSNQNAQTNLSGTVTQVSQSFTGTGKRIGSVKFFLKKFGAPTGNMFAKLHTHAGTFGSSSVPVGAALATSSAITASSLTTTFALITFEFPSSPILANGTNYVVVLQYTLGNASNYVVFGTDTTSPTHPGNYATYSGSWNPVASTDGCFFIYSPPSTWIRCERSFFSNPGRLPQPGDPYIALIKNDDTVTPYQLSGAVDVQPDETRLVSITNVASFDAETTIVSHLLLARFSEPTLEWTYTTPYLATTRIKFMELVMEYPNNIVPTPPPPLPEPAYLFIFREAGIRTDRFTSYENTVRIASGDYAGSYVPAPFSFDAVKSGLKLDQEKLDLKSFKFTGNPLNKMWPFALDGILTVEIIEVRLNPTDPTQPATAPVTRFYGDIWSVDSNYKATAVPFGNMFDRKFPRFLLSVSDNYTMFSTPTQVSAGAYKIQGVIHNPGPPFDIRTSQTVTITSSAARTKILYGLAGYSPPTRDPPVPPDDYFAGGWLEFGANATKEKRGILRSVTAAGSDITLTIDRPLLKAIQGQTVDLYPGYDGAIGICDYKYNNRINYGGHPYIPNVNPGVKAIKPKETKGGKKG